MASRTDYLEAKQLLAVGALIIGGLDIWAITTIIRQANASVYPTAIGQIVACRIKNETYGEGSSVIGVEAQYTYTVEEKAYTGNRYRYGFNYSNLPTGAREFVRTHPVGGPVTVYYNPSNPADAVLSAGTRPIDYLLPLALAPFNVGLVWLGVRVGRAAWVARQ
jgi:hypothetical protein